MINPPDPHVRNRVPGLVVIAIAVAIVVGLVVVMANRPGAGMGGSLSDREAPASR